MSLFSHEDSITEQTMKEQRLERNKMKLPIQLIPNTDPPRFKWSINGTEQINLVPPYLETSLIDLIALTIVRQRDAERLSKEVEVLVKENVKLHEQLAKYIQQSNDPPDDRTITITNANIDPKPVKSSLKKGK